MSMFFGSIEGFGVDGEVLGNIDTEKFVSFLEEYDPQSFQELTEEFTLNADNFEGIEEFLLDDEECWNEYSHLIYYLLQALENVNKGVHFEYFKSNVDGEEALIFPSTYPWRLTEAEDNLTLESLTLMFTEVFDAITNLERVIVDYVSVRYSA